MNSNHYPSLGLCKKLQEVEFPETTISIVQDFNGKDFICDHYEYNREDFIACCPSVMEMLDVIPRVHPEDEGIYHFIQRCYQGQNIFETGYVPNYQGADNICEFYGTLPNVLAEMILWLVENKHLTFK